MLQNILTSPATNMAIDPVLFIIAMLEAFLLGVVVRAVYRWRHHYSTQGPSFQTSMLVMAPLICLILMLIGSNLALSIGMVGALSIVRFRTVLKDPLDLMFLFLLIGVGLGCGTYNFTMTLIGTSLILAALALAQTKTEPKRGGTLTVRGENEKTVLSFCDDLRQKLPHAHRQRLDLSPGAAEVALHIPQDCADLFSVLNELKQKHSVSHVSYYGHSEES